jgi:hypothetical protein
VGSLLQEIRPDDDPVAIVEREYFLHVLAGAAGLSFHGTGECRRPTGSHACDPAVVEEHARIVEPLLLAPRRLPRRRA